MHVIKSNKMECMMGRVLSSFKKNKIITIKRANGFIDIKFDEHTLTA